MAEVIESDDSDDSVLEEARQRFADAQSRDKENREAANEDTQFVYVPGKQWPDQIKAERDGDGEPSLEFPQLKQFVNQVVNDQRQNRPGIRVHPAGGQSSIEIAKLKQGLIRHIEYDSQAEAVYDEGFKHAVVGGRGYWRIVSEYENDSSFNQDLKLKRINDPNTVWSDLDFQAPDGGDKNWAIVTEEVKKEDFERRWPKAEPLSWQVSEFPNWYGEKECVIVADYFRRVSTKRTLVMNSDGNSGYKDGMPDLPPGVSTVAEREVECFTVEWYKIAGGEQVLETYKWPGTIVPVVCCMGDEIMVDGKRIFQGLTRQARDAQRMYNYEQSAKVARYALAPKAPYMAPAEAIAGYEDVWKNANKRPYSTLPYNAFTEDGRPLPQPERVQPAPMEGGWIEAAQASKQDMRSVIGMYENSLGMRGQETSGRAIVAREKQGDNATFHFVDNLSRAISLTGRILLELIPHYYDTQRIVTIIGDDDTRNTQTINQQDPMTGQVVKNDMKGQDYSVTVEAGPSYATKRQEMSDVMMSLVQSFPMIMQYAGDLVFGSMDFADSDKLAERAKLMLPPPVQAALAAEAQGQDPQVAQMAQQLQQMHQQSQQMQQQMMQQMQQMNTELQQAKQQAADKSQEREAKANELSVTASTEQRRMDLEEREFTVNTLMKLLELQQTQAQPIGPEAAGMEPVADGLVQGGDQMQAMMQAMTQLHAAVSAPRRMSLDTDPDGNIVGGTSTLVQ